MSIPNDSIRSAHHVGLYSWVKDWPRLRAFWESLGFTCRIHSVTDASYDHAGAGERLQVFAGAQLIVSYYAIQSNPVKDYFYDCAMGMIHIGLSLAPAALEAARCHPAFERETHWGYSNVSVFLTGPYGLHVECVTHDPDFHNEL